MKHIYFVRHGLSELNVAGLMAGSTETPLVAEGRAQARVAGQEARRLGIDRIVCSPMGRTRETAEIIAAEAVLDPSDITYDENLKERHFGALEGQPYMPSNMRSKVDGIEPKAELLTRVRRAYEDIQQLPDEKILVVSHGSTGRALRHVIDPSIPFRVTDRSPQFPNAHIMQLL
jgi:broad specificity phosphatase PhoE